MKKKIALSMSMIMAATAVTSIGVGFSLQTLSSYGVDVVGVPTDVVIGNVQSWDTEWNEASNDAKVTISNGTAKVTGLNENGYYSITFCTKNKEIGKAEFFVGESGKIYTYDYELRDGEYIPVFEVASEVGYEGYGYGRILDLSGKHTVTVSGIPDTVSVADISVSLENGDYGNSNKKISLSEECVTFDLGISGNYWITFSDDSDSPLGTAEFTLNDEGKVFVEDFELNDTTGEWESVLTETEVVFFTSYDDYGDFGLLDDDIGLFSVAIGGVPSSIKNVEVIYLNDSMEQLDCFAEISINGNGTVSVNQIDKGYYTINFLNGSNECVGCAMFYLDENGETYSYDSLNKIESVKYTSVEQERAYTYGKTKVSIYGIPEDIDSVEAFYYFGDTTDKTIMFEPDMSSLYVEPMVISNLGMDGKYKLNFYLDGVVVGNADFYVGKDGKIYEIDYELNSSTGNWEEIKTETEEIYYYDNTDVEDSDDYDYGNVKFTITNVPTSLEYAEITFYENDDTFTAGTMIFPSVTINGKGTVVVNNLGQSGYYEVDLLDADGFTKIGYVFVYVDENLNIYSIKQTINTDTFQVETNMTKTIQIPLEEYLSSTIEYTSGNRKVIINNVPSTANKIFATCVTPTSEYSSFDRDITITSNGQLSLDKLGMEGDYTVSFYTNKDYIGSATFYLGSDGKTYEAKYSYDSSNGISINLAALSKVIFVPNSDSITYEVGDVDFSGDINVGDLVILQKYLLGANSFTASQWYNADMDGDGRVDVFDLILMRKKLINKITN